MKKTSNHNIVRFTIGLLFLLGVAFPIHGYLQTLWGFHFFGNHLVEDYTFNALFALSFYSFIEWRKKNLGAYLGYAFLFSSVLKFILFLTILYPNYKIDNKLRSADFFAFFIPYAMCLIYETLAMVKRLKEADSDA
jgi:hypothetical protein